MSRQAHRLLTFAPTLAKAGLAWLALAGAAAAQFIAMPAETPPAAPDGAIVPAPQWVEGSEWEYSDGYAVRVTSASGPLAVFERLDVPGQWYSRFGFLRQDQVTPDDYRRTIFRTISPYDGTELVAGQPLTYRREYLKDGEQLVHATSWTVEGREKITVPAGTFECWIIVWRSRSLTSNWTGFERWWYSPELQHYVRMEYRYGATPTYSRVLMRYSLPAAAPAPTASSQGGETENLFRIEGERTAGADMGLIWTADLQPVPVDIYPLPLLDGAPRRAAELAPAPEPDWDLDNILVLTSAD